MRILSVSLDRRVLDPSHPVGRRQAEYYRGHEVSYIILDDPKRSKLVTLFIAWLEARRVRGVDLVTTQDPFFCGWIGRVAARASKAPLHVQDHSGAFARNAFGWKERLMHASARKTLQAAARVRTVSQRGKRGLVEAGVSEDRIDVIPIAADVTRFTLHASRDKALPQQVLCIARLEVEKGIDILLYAFAELHKTYPQAALVIVGDGSLRKSLERLARRLHIADAVLFAGRQDDVLPFLDRAGIYVQPSRFEGWGMAVIEAAAAGMPIVMSDVGCAGEVIKDGESGLVVPSGNAPMLSKALERLLSDETLRRSLSEAARTASASLPSAEATRETLRASFLLCR